MKSDHIIFDSCAVFSTFPYPLAADHQTNITCRHCSNKLMQYSPDMNLKFAREDARKWQQIVKNLVCWLVCENNQCDSDMIQVNKGYDEIDIERRLHL